MSPDARPGADRWPSGIGQVARHLLLDEIRLVMCHAHGVPSEAFDPNDYDTRWMVSVVDLSAETGSIEMSGGLTVLARFNYFEVSRDDGGDVEGGAAGNGGEPRGEADEDPEVDVEAVFMLVYEPADPETGAEVNADDVRAFAQYNATFNAWPYWREFVQSTAARMGLSLITIPLLPVPKVFSRSEAQDDPE